MNFIIGTQEFFKAFIFVLPITLLLTSFLKTSYEETVMIIVGVSTIFGLGWSFSYGKYKKESREKITDSD